MITNEMKSDYLLEAQFRKNKSQDSYFKSISNAFSDITELHYNSLSSLCEEWNFF